MAELFKLRRFQREARISALVRIAGRLYQMPPPACPSLSPAGSTGSEELSEAGGAGQAFTASLRWPGPPAWTGTPGFCPSVSTA